VISEFTFLAPTADSKSYCSKSVRFLLAVPAEVIPFFPDAYESTGFLDARNSTGSAKIGLNSKELKRPPDVRKKISAQRLQSILAIWYLCGPNPTGALWPRPASVLHQKRRIRHESQTATQVSRHSPGQSSAQGLGTMVSGWTSRHGAARRHENSFGSEQFPRDVIGQAAKSLFQFQKLTIYP
jgi:hypothetical protein